MYRIGEFSKMSKTTVKTIRFYNEIGLLVPEEIDKFTGYRLYTTEQLIKLHRIQSYRQIGLSIEEVKKILNGCNELEILTNRKKEIQLNLNNANAQLTHLEFILYKKESCFMNYNATVKKTDECIVYSVELVLPSYESYFEVLPAIGEKLKKKYPKLKCIVPEYCFVRYLDGEYKEKNIHIEYCEAVDKLMPDFDDVKFKKMKSIEIVSFMHKGSYAELPKVYAYAMKWVEENGYKISDTPRESYIDGIWNKESETEWLTEIQIPIKK